jgi:undecaprenyl-diphosphatase
MTPPLERIAALGVLTATARRTPAGRLESRLIGAVTASRTPWTVVAARATTRLGCRPVALLAAGLADIIAAKRSRAVPAPSALLVVTAGMAARAVLSDVVARPRPPAEGWLARPHGFSYPSRHTTAAALGFGALARSVPPRYQPVARLTAAVLTGAVGTSRVYLGVHWITDVLGGWLFGSLWLCLPRSVDALVARRGSARAAATSGRAPTASR